MNSRTLVFILILGMPVCCSSEIDDPIIASEDNTFYYGADLSYVNEMEDCGAVYRDKNNITRDVYDIFKEEGVNLVRYRLWHNPQWTNYSNLQDVKKSIRRAKSSNFKVLLDFHYSDTWTDPAKQQIPSAWVEHVDNVPVLSKLLYDYTYDVLNGLFQEGLIPDIVQVGNEINPMILQNGELVWPIDWSRNSALINEGIRAVRDVSTMTNYNIDVMLHIAQPENALWWFDQATNNGVNNFDWIGLSYYPQHSKYTLQNIDVPIFELINSYNKKLMIVETAYPFTLINQDDANNILKNDALISGFPASQQGQLDYLNTLTTKIKGAGGAGVVYWEPAWVSTNCETLWGTGSHWDNATLFDENGKVNLGMQFYNQNLSSKN